MKPMSDQFKDIDGNVLAQRRNHPRPLHGHIGDRDEDDLQFDYQVAMVHEGGPRALNSMQQFLNKTEVVLPDPD